jgi:hypothetical protein
MITVKARLARDPATERAVVCEEAWMAPDHFAHEYCIFRKPGDTAFIETWCDHPGAADGHWILWRVQCARVGSVLGYYVFQISESEMRAEIEESRKRGAVVRDVPAPKDSN